METTATVTSVTTGADGKVLVVVEITHAGRRFEQNLLYQPTVMLTLVELTPPVIPQP